MLQEKNIKQIVIVENFISQFINDNAQSIIDSFKPFLGKKIRTANGFVSKYNKPEITAEISQKLKEMGIVRLDFNIRFETYTNSTSINFNFYMYGSGDTIFNNYNNPFGSGYISEHVFSIEIKDTILTKINDFKPRILIDTDKVIQDYQKALDLKSEYNKALNEVHYRLRSYAK